MDLILSRTRLEQQMENLKRREEAVATGLPAAENALIAASDLTGQAWLALRTAELNEKAARDAWKEQMRLADKRLREPKPDAKPRAKRTKAAPTTAEPVAAPQMDAAWDKDRCMFDARKAADQYANSVTPASELSAYLVREGHDVALAEECADAVIAERSGADA